MNLHALPGSVAAKLANGLPNEHYVDPGVFAEEKQSVLFANWYTAVISLGILSLMLGFALQTPITSFIGWVYLLLKAPYRVGERLIRRPRHRGSFTAIFNGSRATAFADLEVRGSVRDIEPTFGASGGVFDADGFAVLDIGGAFRISRLLEVFGRVENVADRSYEEAFGFPAPGRLVLGGVRVAAGR